MTTPSIRRLDRIGEREVGELADVLVDCVEGGASVSFMLPLSRGRAVAYWRRIGEDVASGRRIVLAADDEAGIVGTVQLALDMPENQPHRADVAKMLVHRRGRRRGIAEALMRAVEQAARNAGRTVLVLDTVVGSDADRLYRRLGWEVAGVIPDYAFLPAGGLCATRYFYRRL